MMKKDVKWMKGRLEELRRMDMRMWKLCEPNSGEQRHFDGRLAAIEEALEFIDNLDEEPYNIQKLIHDYEYKTGTFDWATALRGAFHGEREEEVDQAYKDGYEKGKEHAFEKVGWVDKEPETVADVVTTFWKSFERLKEVMSMEVEELEE